MTRQTQWVNDLQKLSICRALISVSDKSGIVDFSRRLAQLGVEIISTGNTFALLQEHNIAAIEVAEHTGFPEIMGGRVKTLHPKIHAGILARPGIDNATLASHDIAPVDMVVVNLYPFEQTVKDATCTVDDAVENVDIGGPAMIRAAAKNHASTAVLTDPAQYERIACQLESEGGLDSNSLFQLAVQAFERTAAYDAAIANHFGLFADGPTAKKQAYPQRLSMQWVKATDLRYGENPHQSAAFYVDQDQSAQTGSVANARMVQGKPLSYNNVVDADTALECVKQFVEPTCVIVKHANPCGVASAENCLDAYSLAYMTDPTSAFGGIVAFNRPLDEVVTKTILDRQFVEVIIAPAVTSASMELIKAKPNVRVLVCGDMPLTRNPFVDMRRINGGLLVQDADTTVPCMDDVTVVSERVPQENEMKDLLFAWKVGIFVKSNAIVFCKNSQTVGVGAGQMSRVYSARIAALKAADEGLEIGGSVMASDAFFPFRDSIDTAAAVGVTAVIQPGGSMRDEEVIRAANECGMAMVFAGTRHFRH